MSLEVIISLIALIGSFVGWLVTERKSREAENIKLEQRISDIEKSIMINSTTDNNSINEISDIKNSLKESFGDFKTDMKVMDSRVRSVELKLATIEGEKKRN
ncbi:hypothetical protein AT520_003959 [Escherichia coli]|nr:hypothetical protein [Escherichia coli]EJA4827485.1 hypothetical protein [Escherichia coli]EJI1860921.1 hypothetical protein [Escherichia coli]EJK2348740.1 hypothetical protein [Escherichia coli]HBA9622962.1 hypothetical protein [Escherichia coli]